MSCGIISKAAERQAKAADIEASLAQFIGTERHYRHWTGKLKWTDGVNYLAEAAGAFWLIDAIASYQGERVITKDPMLCDMQFWKLVVYHDAQHPKPMAILTCVADSDRDPSITQKIEYTDFPLKSISLWVENGVLYLPQER